MKLMRWSEIDIRRGNQPYSGEQSSCSRVASSMRRVAFIAPNKKGKCINIVHSHLVYLFAVAR